MTIMPRSIWSGSLSFGLVNVPVKLVTAVSSKDVRFHQLHGKDGGRVQQKRVCSKDGEEVPYDEIAKGYEIAPDQYVMVDSADLEGIDPEASHTIDIEDFVSLDEIDPVYFDRTYYLAPDKAGKKPYALLLAAMQQARKVAVGRFVMRGKEYLVAIRPIENALAIETMHFADEVAPADAAVAPEDVDQSQLSEKELAMAEQLIEALAGTFDPAKYHDEYRARVLDLIERKAQGQEIIVAPEPTAPPRTVDLAAALEASLAKARERQKAEV